MAWPSEAFPRRVIARKLPLALPPTLEAYAPSAAPATDAEKKPVLFPKTDAAVLVPLQYVTW